MTTANPNPCWCCGRECMFCEPGEAETQEEHARLWIEPLHWCAECKYSGCENCCGCPECQLLKRAGWSPRELPLQERVPHLRQEEGTKDNDTADAQVHDQ